MVATAFEDCTADTPATGTAGVPVAMTGGAGLVIPMLGCVLSITCGGCQHGNQRKAGDFWTGHQQGLLCVSGLILVPRHRPREIHNDCAKTWDRISHKAYRTNNDRRNCIYQINRSRSRKRGPFPSVTVATLLVANEWLTPIKGVVEDK